MSSEATIELQLGYDGESVPSEAQFNLWVNTCLEHQGITKGYITIRIIGLEESQSLNNTYRGKDKPTNVLSFAFDTPPGIPEEEFADELGDLAICAPVVVAEAKEQLKDISHHWAHLVIHGTLHLLGYDHIENDEAEEMELLETQILCKLDIKNPYTIRD